MPGGLLKSEKKDVNPLASDILSRPSSGK